MYVSVAAKQQAGASPRHGRGDNRKRERSLSGLKAIILKDKDQRNFLLIKARGGSGQRQTEPKMAEKVRADRCKGCNMTSLPCLCHRHTGGLDPVPRIYGLVSVTIDST